MAGRPISSLGDSGTRCSQTKIDVCHSHVSKVILTLPHECVPAGVFHIVSLWPLAPPYLILLPQCLGTPVVPWIECVTYCELGRKGDNWENSRDTFTNLTAKRTSHK